MVKRQLDLNRLLPLGRSTFLFGARGTGKTKSARLFLKKAGASWSINLLDSDTFRRYILRPSLLRQEINVRLKKHKHLTVFIDEIQKCPLLLDEVHSLIEDHKGRLRFLLTGSSARKLKRGGANLLAGRAWTFHLHPLTYKELDLQEERILRYGTLPGICLDDPYPDRTLRAYVDIYLREEIFQEALVRQVEGFMRFMDVIAQMNGEPLNFAALARESGTALTTVQDYVSILEDTLVAHRIPGWSKSVRKQLLKSPKVYFFDCGVLNALQGNLSDDIRESSFRFGRLFETRVIQEIIRQNDYLEKGYRLHYWRSNTGIEVDIILSRGPAYRPWAVEIKSSIAPLEKDLTGLRSFAAENPHARLLCLCRSPQPFHLGNIDVLPWQDGIDLMMAEG